LIKEAFKCNQAWKVLTAPQQWMLESS